MLPLLLLACSAPDTADVATRSVMRIDSVDDTGVIVEDTDTDEPDDTAAPDDTGTDTGEPGDTAEPDDTDEPTDTGEPIDTAPPCDGFVATPDEISVESTDPEEVFTITLSGCATGVVAVDNGLLNSSGSVIYMATWDDVPDAFDGEAAVTITWDGGRDGDGSMLLPIESDQGTVNVALTYTRVSW